MPSILKRSSSPDAVPYQFPQAQTLGTPPPAPPSDAQGSQGQDAADTATLPDSPPSTERAPPSNPIEFAQVQAEAILEDARSQAAKLMEQAKIDIEAELERLRDEARQDGYRLGYAGGISGAMADAQKHRTEQSIALGEEIKQFLERATFARDELLDQTRNELKDLCIAIAEKIVRVSLKSSGDIIVRMIQNATEKMKRKEWVHIYVAECDAKNIAKIAPQLTETLAYLSDHVKIIPMGDDESGTCIIETPDEIIDASASTQLSSIRDIIAGG